MEVRGEGTPKDGKSVKSGAFKNQLFVNRDDHLRGQRILEPSFHDRKVESHMVSSVVRFEPSV
jgi:hypothetical protein